MDRGHGPLSGQLQAGCEACPPGAEAARIRRQPLRVPNAGHGQAGLQLRGFGLRGCVVLVLLVLLVLMLALVLGGRVYCFCFACEWLSAAQAAVALLV